MNNFVCLYVRVYVHISMRFMYFRTFNVRLVRGSDLCLSAGTGAELWFLLLLLLQSNWVMDSVSTLHIRNK